MTRAMKVCARPGCPTLTNSTHCAAHQPKPWSTHGAGQGRGRTWRKQRWACLERDNFTCVDCGYRDPTGRTLEADHIGPTDQIEHLRTRCTDCHRTKTLADATASRTATRTPRGMTP